MSGQNKILTKALTAGTWISFDVALSGEVIKVSQDFKEYTGFSAKDIVGIQISDVIEKICTDNFKAAVIHSIRKVLSNHKIRTNLFVELNLANNQFLVPSLMYVERKTSSDQVISIIFHDLSAYDNIVKKIESQNNSSKLLIEHENIISMKLNRNLNVLDMIGDCQKLIGYTRDEFLKDPNIWLEFLSNPHQQRIVYKLKTVRSKFSDEITLLNVKTKQISYFYVSLVPLFDDYGNFDGWEAFGFDVTEKREEKNKLLRERKHLKALYEISSAIQQKNDQTSVALKGLLALIAATKANSGFVVLSNELDFKLKVACSSGLSANYLRELIKSLKGNTLVKSAIKTGDSLMIENLQTDSQAIKKLAEIEGLKSAIIVPMKSEIGVAMQKTIGAVVLFSKSSNRFKDSDLKLVEASSNHIALMSSKVKNYESERNHSSKLKTLLNLKKLLASARSPEQVAQQTVNFLKGQFEINRIWVGSLSPEKLKLLLLATFGVNDRFLKRVLSVQLTDQNLSIKKVLNSKRPKLAPGFNKIACADSSLMKVLETLRTGPLVLMPLVDRDLILGLIVVEPKGHAKTFYRANSEMLKAISAELAATLNDVKHEQKATQAEKMQIASTLASGVAHNFNNILQTIIGQASLIEMQSNGSNRVTKAAKNILKSASKGAQLVNQLLDFTAQRKTSPKIISVNKLVASLNGLFKSISGHSADLKFETSPDLPRVLADISQLQYVLTQLVVNAVEAVKKKGSGAVKICTLRRKIHSYSSEYNLSPGMYVQIVVSDTGCGMKEQELQRCCEPFFTSKNQDQRTGIGLSGDGLGLAACFNIVKQHRGELLVTSEEGIGTAVSIYLPALQEAMNTKNDSEQEFAIKNWVAGATVNG